MVGHNMLNISQVTAYKTKHSMTTFLISNIHHLQHPEFQLSHPSMAPPSTSNKSSGRYAVVVCKGGDIKVKEGCKPWTIYSRKWFEDNKCNWFLAVRLFCGEYSCAPRFSDILATILQPDILSNKAKRHHI
jgi:hypothetical protein